MAAIIVHFSFLLPKKEQKDFHFITAARSSQVQAFFIHVRTEMRILQLI